MTNTYFPTAEPTQPLGAVLLLTANTILGPALETALASLGWDVLRQPTWTSQADQDRPGQHLLLVSDGTGSLPASPAYGRAAGSTCIAVGARNELATLIRAMADGAQAVAGADRPFTDLVHRLHELLSKPVSFDRTTEIFDQLESKAATAIRLRSLTGRQRQVLVALAQGHTAAQIAGREHLAMATVRSHIKAILAELDTASQLNAVALAHRACDDPAVLAALDELHHF